MSEIQLCYGSSDQTFSFDENRFKVLSKSSTAERPLTDVEIGDAFTNAIDSPPLDDLFNSGDSVLIVVSDATRATASDQIVNLLVRRLIQNGVSPSDIAIIFATGIHRAVTADEKSELVTPFITQRIRTLDHNAYDAKSIISLGVTARGTPIELNKSLKEFSRVVITGAAGFHYFAGFTGGRKSICPGLASAKTIEATHMLALDFETGGRRAGVETGRLAGNAVHEECEAIASVIEPFFGITTVVDERGRATKVFAGHWQSSHRAACEHYTSERSVNIDSPRDLVIVSAGGLPYDINLIQAHKALDMAAHACRDGGTIVLLAECRDGLGRSDFLKWFDEPDSLRLAQRLKREYEVNGQTAWALLTKAERFCVHLVSNLEPDVVRQMRMTPATSIEAVITSLTPTATGYILPRGAALWPRLTVDPSVRQE